MSAPMTLLTVATEPPPAASWLYVAAVAGVLLALIVLLSVLDRRSR